MGEERGDQMQDNETEEALTLRVLPISLGSVDGPQEERRCFTSIADLDVFEFVKGADGEVLCTTDDLFSPSGDGIFPWSSSVAKAHASFRFQPEEHPPKPVSKPDPLFRVFFESRINWSSYHNGGSRKLERASRMMGYGERFQPSRLRWRLLGLVKAPEIELKDLHCSRNQRIQAGPNAECGTREGKRTGKIERDAFEDTRV